MKCKGFTTQSLNTPLPKKDSYGALHMPVYDGVTFEFGSAQEMEEVFSGRQFAHAYARTSNPTVEYFEHKMKSITGCRNVLALSSGMAAISSAVVALVEKGENIIASNHLFGHTYAFFKQTLASFGIEVRFADVADLKDVESKRDDKTRLLFFETITNPQLEIVDLQSTSVYCKQHGILLMVDSTTTPPYIFDSKKWGVDVEVMSTTKFISGGAAAFGGAILDNGTFDYSQLPALKSWSQRFGADALIARLRKEIFRHFGGSMTAHTAHYMNIGLDVLALRVDRSVSNCMALGEFLKTLPQVKDVNYPGLADNAYFQLSETQFKGKPGGVLTFDLESDKACYAFMDKLEVIRRATNLSDNKTLIILPYHTIYSEFSAQEKEEMGIRPTSMRLSVGIEDVEDLVADIVQALS
jgi:O-acetylhomoserine (thiol)-lyase